MRVAREGRSDGVRLLIEAGADVNWRNHVRSCVCMYLYACMHASMYVCMYVCSERQELMSIGEIM